MINIPSGNVTFLFTDTEDSIMLTLDNQNDLKSSLKNYYSIIEQSVTSNNGFIFKTIGDAFCCSFENDTDAVNASFDFQKRITNEVWNGTLFKVRMGIHSGKAEWKGNDYSGYITLATASRVASAANGGQILISKDAVSIDEEKLRKGISFRDLGERRLKDLKEPMRLFQLVSAELTSDFPPLKTLDARPNNLPVQLTNFIGRENELTEIKELLKTSRLTTLLGPGGTGKTRLSIQAGADVIDEFVNGVWFIEFASLIDPSLILYETASALGLKEDGGRNISGVLIDYLKQKELLLIFDNCEHLISECAKLFQSLLTSCPKLRIIASSRESLKIPGEKVFPVPVLSIPAKSEFHTADSVKGFEAVQLFTDRACSVRQDFKISNENASAVVQLCHRLDGIPLALELAAARIKVMTVEKILENISNRFRLLTDGNRTALPRQQTLRALIDWSYDLLSEKEKLLFQQLSVFSGGWSLEAAEAVCCNDEIEEFEIIDLISDLTDKSIIISKETDGATRFSMLETIRQYCIERSHTSEDVHKKHFQYFLRLSESDDSKKDYLYDYEWKKIMEPEQDNLRYAIKWSLDNYIEQSAELIKNVADFWEITGNYTESYETLKKLLGSDIEINPSLKADLSLNAAFLSSQLDETDQADNYIQSALEFFKTSGNKTRTAECLSVYGMISFTKGETELAFKLTEEALDLLRDQNKKNLEANIKGNLATYCSAKGDAEYALKLLEEAILTYRELNDKNLLSKLLVSKGGIFYQSGDLEKAKNCFEEGLLLLEELNDQFSYTTTLYNLGNLNFQQKRYSEAMGFYEAARTRSKEYGLINIYDRSYIKEGEIALILNDKEKAKDIFISCLESFGKNSEKLKLILCIYGLGSYFYYEKNYAKSARLFLLADRMNEDFKFRFSGSRLGENKIIISDLKEKLTDIEFDHLKNQTNDLNLDNASQTALSVCNE